MPHYKHKLGNIEKQMENISKKMTKLQVCVVKYCFFNGYFKKQERSRKLEEKQRLIDEHKDEQEKRRREQDRMLEAKPAKH